MRRTYDRTLEHLRGILAGDGHDEAYRTARDWLDVLAELRGLGHSIHEAQVDIERAALALKLFGPRTPSHEELASRADRAEPPHRPVAATDATEHRMPA